METNQHKGVIMISLNKFAISKIGKFSLGKSTPETKTIEFETIKRCVKCYKSNGNANFATYATKAVRHAITRQKISTEEIIHKVPKDRMENSEEIINNEFEKVRSFSSFDRDFLAVELKKLPKRARRYIASNYGLIGESKTSTEIAAKEGLTQQRVNKIINDNIKKMRGNI